MSNEVAKHIFSIFATDLVATEMTDAFVFPTV